MIEYFIQQDEDITAYLTEEEIQAEAEQESTSNPKFVYTTEGSLYQKNRADRTEPVSDVHSLADEKNKDFKAASTRKNYKRMNQLNASIEF